MIKDGSHKRHLAKTITWRIIGTLDTIFLSWFITGNALTGLKIGAVEVVTKMLLYYLHERFWFRMQFSDTGILGKSRRRHIAKTFSWRFIGTMDTMLISWAVSGNAWVGVQIGFAELVTKMLLYYFHERIWYRFNYGLKART